MAKESDSPTEPQCFGFLAVGCAALIAFAIAALASCERLDDEWRTVMAASMFADPPPLRQLAWMRVSLLGIIVLVPLATVGVVAFVTHRPVKGWRLALVLAAAISLVGTVTLFPMYSFFSLSFPTVSTAGLATQPEAVASFNQRICTAEQASQLASTNANAATLHEEDQIVKDLARSLPTTTTAWCRGAIQQQQFHATTSATTRSDPFYLLMSDPSAWLRLRDSSITLALCDFFSVFVSWTVALGAYAFAWEYARRVARAQANADTSLQETLVKP